MHRTNGIGFKVAISILIAISLGISWLPAAAASRPDDPVKPAPADDSALSDVVMGHLVVKTGEVRINGNASETGATVLTDSEVSTSRDTEAVIDLGVNGRIDLGSGTTVRMKFEADLIFVESECGRVEVDVFRGQVDVKEPDEEIIPAGEDEEYGDQIEATAPMGSHFRIDCEGRKVLAWLPLSLSSLLLLGFRSNSVDVLGPPPATPNTP
jgi:hypothetical protein